MIKTLDYIIAESNNGKLFKKFVMEKLNEGYELFGTPFIRSDSFCQCIVKVDKSDELKKVQQVLNTFMDIEKKQNPLRTIDEKGEKKEFMPEDNGSYS